MLHDPAEQALYPLTGVWYLPGSEANDKQALPAVGSEGLAS
ncbi:hypothetical protein J2T17_004041 [Paenibacillus mucilaginosus]|uniref:Uncharacterized protein n=1 Tax=Paenibacillus mucilaginosus (strain KNP414) TaxID=1036673 RepID=F8FAN6_PAEMK|nr:hypothetical protein KNP414_02564 [Paenibacillus mucilaginosus KNP414]